MGRTSPSAHAMRLSARYIAVISLAAATAFPLTGFGRPQGSAPEATLLALANRERGARHLPPLRWNEALAGIARWHAQQMARRGELSHQFPNEPGLADRAKRAGVQFAALAENVAQGSDAESIHRQWMHSAAHRQNLLDPELDSLGIAVIRQGGVLFAVQDFSGGAPAASAVPLAEQEQRVGARLRARGLRLLPATREARRTCRLDNGYVGARQPDFVLHYFTTDLDDLPDMLEGRIRSGGFGSAVVGACPAGKIAARQGVSGFRIAVMLFR